MIHTNTQNELLRISFHTNTSVSWTALALKGLGEVVLVRPWEWLFLLLGWTLESLIHLARGSSRPQCVVWTRNLMNNLVILLTIIRNRFHVTFVIISNQYHVFFLITSRLKPHFEILCWLKGILITFDCLELYGEENILLSKRILLSLWYWQSVYWARMWTYTQPLPFWEDAYTRRWDVLDRLGW